MPSIYLKMLVFYYLFSKYQIVFCIHQYCLVLLIHVNLSLSLPISFPLKLIALQVFPVRKQVKPQLTFEPEAVRLGMSFCRMSEDLDSATFVLDQLGKCFTESQFIYKMWGNIIIKHLKIETNSGILGQMKAVYQCKAMKQAEENRAFEHWPIESSGLAQRLLTQTVWI